MKWWQLLNASCEGWNCQSIVGGGGVMLLHPAGKWTEMRTREWKLRGSLEGVSSAGGKGESCKRLRLDRKAV